MHSLAPETEYLCDLARAWANGVDGTVPPVSELDEDRFLRMLSGQPAMQTIVRHLDRSVLPTVEQPRLDRAVDISRRRTTMMLLELERVLPALAEVGCTPVVLKGASLALTVYDAPEDRWFVDLDLLVDPDEVDTCYDALDRLGYRFQERPGGARYYEKYHFHRILMSNQGVCIEVHWALTMPRSTFRYDLPALRAVASEFTLGNASFLAPHALDQVLHGVLQSIPCGYSDLRRILDLHRLDAELTEPERRILCERANAANLATGLWLQYHLRETILGYEMPLVVDLQCGPSATVRRLFDRLDITAGCLEKQAVRSNAFLMLVIWLCVPAGAVPREVWRYVAPSEEMRLEVEMSNGRPASPADTLRLVWERLGILWRLSGRLVRTLLAG